MRNPEVKASLHWKRGKEEAIQASLILVLVVNYSSLNASLEGHPYHEAPVGIVNFSGVGSKS